MTNEEREAAPLGSLNYKYAAHIRMRSGLELIGEYVEYKEDFENNLWTDFLMEPVRFVPEKGLAAFSMFSSVDHYEIRWEDVDFIIPLHEEGWNIYQRALAQFKGEVEEDNPFDDVEYQPEPVVNKIIH